MIYRNEKAGVYKIDNDLHKSTDFTIGYKVGDIQKEVTFDYKYLPQDIIDEFAKVTNKIARYIEEDQEFKRKELIDLDIERIAKSVAQSVEDKISIEKTTERFDA